MLVLAAVAFGRPDLVVVALPFAVSLLVGLAPWRPATLSAQVRLGTDTLAEGMTLPADVALRCDTDLDVVVVRLVLDPWLQPVQGSAVRVLALGSDRSANVVVTVAAQRWGRRRVGPVQVFGFGAALLAQSPVVTSPRATVRVLPRFEPYAVDADLPHAVTTAGSHRSVLRGDGLDFAGIRPFAPGDRPRRVNWRVSQRLGQLHVVEAHTERSADVVVLLDSGQDAGLGEGFGGRASSLDIAVRAAAGISAHHLARGDTVRLLDVGLRVRQLPRVTGRRQMVRVLDWLLDAPLVATGQDWTPERVAAFVPARSLVLAMTPLLDDRVSSLVAALRQRGQPLVIVDTLPEGALPPPADRRTDLAQRLWRLEREQLLARLGEVGVPVVPWAGSGSLDPVLRVVALLSSAPRTVRT